MDPKINKKRITIYLDVDLIDIFKSRSMTAGALPYQHQINSALRKFCEFEEFPLDCYTTKPCGLCSAYPLGADCPACNAHGQVLVLKEPRKCVPCKGNGDSGQSKKAGFPFCPYCKGRGWFAAIALRKPYDE